MRQTHALINQRILFVPVYFIRKHLQSTFPPMMEDYMSGEELSKHLGRQMSIHTEKCKEPSFEGELDEVRTCY